ncbi:ClpX C4-type zinc finger protein [Arthrobacter sp. 2MCAF15]|uniref:ClpX C4-type zinc finger protein n=1 Tax=Arthrobacter sp. 2MCAF15 TaxID=3232984 RepID=UPI003F933962
MSNDRPRDFCTFCGLTPPSGTRLIAGPGVTICELCVAEAGKILRDTSTEGSSKAMGPVWDKMSDAEILQHLPEISRVSLKVEEQLRIWVRAARERKITWSQIGAALDITRQSAWERFKEHL